MATMKTGIKIVVGSLIGAAAIHVAFIACNDGGPGDGGILDALFGDQKAQAGIDGGSCGCVSQVVTADTDTGQLLRGVATGSAKILEGPFVLTDFQAPSSNNVGGYSVLATFPSSPTCPEEGYLNLSGDAGSSLGMSQVDINGANQPNTNRIASEIHGGRYLVRAGEMLCLAGQGGMWSGFIPYR